MIGDTELKVAKLYDMLPDEAGDDVRGPHRRRQRHRALGVHHRPGQEDQAMLIYPMSTGRNFDEVLRLLDSLSADREAQGGDAGELEARRGRHHPDLGLRRAGEAEVSRTAGRH